MTKINQLKVKNIRSHADISVNFTNNNTVITGNNGSGKTSLLEAIYIAFRGSSFKGSDKEILNNNSSWWRIDILTDDENITVKFDNTKNAKRKQFEIDEKIYYRLPHNHKKPIILFEPDDLRLIHGSPSRRRQFLDRFISQLDKNYSVVLSRYEKAIKQRNSLLQKEYITNDDLFAWNVMISDYGSKIVKTRNEYIKLLNETLNIVYKQISNEDIKVKLGYSHNENDFTETNFIKQLNNNFERDKFLKNTSVGPHRHDIIFEYNNGLASKIVSRGEARTLILALKMSELEITKNITLENPLILLDDVFSELDYSRQLSLSDMALDCQIIITSAHTPEKLKATKINLD